MEGLVNSDCVMCRVAIGRLTKEMSWCFFIALRWEECLVQMLPIATDDSKDNMLRLWGLMLCTVSSWMLGAYLYLC